MSRRYFDVNGDPIYTPSLNQPNYDFSQPDDSYDGPSDIYRPRQNNDDFSLSGDQINDNENNYFSNVKRKNLEEEKEIGLIQIMQSILNLAVTIF